LVYNGIDGPYHVVVVSNISHRGSVGYNTNNTYITLYSLVFVEITSSISYRLYQKHLSQSITWQILTTKLEQLRCRTTRKLIITNVIKLSLIQIHENQAQNKPTVRQES